VWPVSCGRAANLPDPGSLAVCDMQAEVTDWLQIGKVVGVFGVKGAVKVFSLTDPPENALAYRPWRLVNGLQTREIPKPKGGWRGKHLVVEIDGVTTPEQAHGLIGWQIEVPRTALELDEDEFLLSDLPGWRVVDETGYDYGVVTAWFETPAHWQIVVLGQAGEQVIPWLDEVVLHADPDQRQLVVAWHPPVEGA